MFLAVCVCVCLGVERVEVFVVQQEDGRLNGSWKPEFSAIVFFAVCVAPCESEDEHLLSGCSAGRPACLSQGRS